MSDSLWKKALQATFYAANTAFKEFISPISSFLKINPLHFSLLDTREGNISRKL